jgi:hypothetical protein
MTNPPVVFLGPSAPIAAASEILQAEFLPPVELGDVWRIAQERPAAIGIVDGYFDRIPAVRHKEILYALSLGIPVYGASSMGALRAAELAAFGMIAVGQIASAYLSGALTGDDEVALMHGPAELGYPAFSEPLVNVRATIAAAQAGGVLGASAADAFVGTARALHYPQRSWERVLQEAPAPAHEIAALRQWLPHGRIDQKRADAVEMLERMRGALEGAGRDRPPPAGHAFSPTVIWLETARQETPIGAILEEFLLAEPLAPAVGVAIACAQRAEPVDWLEVLMAEPDWPDRCRRARLKRQPSPAARGPASTEADADDLLAWFFGERLRWPDDLDAFLRDRGWTDPATVLAIASREAAFLGWGAGPDRADAARG